MYTGNGKGKTTAALGAALRAAGHGFRVYMVQFMKGDPNYGELKACRNVPTITIVQSGLPSFVDRDNPTPEDIRLAKKGLKLAKDALFSREYDLVIMDEVNVAVDYGLIDVEEVLELISRRPKEVDLILTGRYAHPKLIEAADMVSEVREVKHHYTKGIKGREGIEY